MSLRLIPRPVTWLGDLVGDFGVLLVTSVEGRLVVIARSIVIPAMYFVDWYTHHAIFQCTHDKTLLEYGDRLPVGVVGAVDTGVVATLAGLDATPAVLGKNKTGLFGQS